MSVDIFFHKFDQSSDTLTLDKIYMQTKIDWRKYIVVLFLFPNMVFINLVKVYAHYIVEVGW